MALINCHIQTCVVCLSIFVVFNFILGAVIFSTYSTLLQHVLFKRLILAPDSFSYELWKETPVPMFIKFYIFNWTNPDEFVNNHSTPVFVELGPYTYTEKHVKVDVSWEHENSTVTYMQTRSWIFCPELSNGRLDDVVRTLNVPLVSAAATVKKWNKPFLSMGFNAFIQGLKEKIYIDATVGEILFDGIVTPLMNVASSSPIPVDVPFDKFAWFYMRNNSKYFDGVFNIYTGDTDISMIGQMNTWNYTTHNGFYPDYCGLVNGSAGEFFPPYLSRNSISMYVPDICRSITLDYHREVSVGKLTGYRFAANERLFSNPPESPENWCFCLERGCKPSGVLDVSSCRFNTPSYVSYPHFLFADEGYTSNISGMTPDESKHLTHIDLEPETGVPLEVNARFQINLLLEKVPHVTIFKNIDEIMIPAIWFENSAQLDSDLSFQLRLYKMAPSIFQTVGSICMILGILALIKLILEVIKR